MTGLLNDGNSIYHSLQAKLERRWKNGLLVQAAYTWSKLIDDIDGSSRANGAPSQDVYNLRADRGIGGTIRRSASSSAMCTRRPSVVAGSISTRHPW
ncbi:MAG TPA: hypothetical protein VNV86_05580 [Candidatus Acidoferrum sp.]|nr:hypothetical protein [Candidatus Acidoferrum sp.]